MKPRNKKKGFTIVELVVVIAVIAVLAAVLIPTFSNIVKKAQKSSDTQLVRNLNTALVVDGEEPTTMQAALDAAADAGYIVEKIKASDGNEILWDSVNNCFVYMEEGKTKPTYIPDTEKEEVKDYQLWQIVDEVPATQKYSLYLTGEDYAQPVAVSVGFDAGKNSNIPSISYSHDDSANPQNTVIRTNSASTNLTVDAAADTIKHYDSVGFVDIVKTANASYHEYGTADYVQNASGRVVVEQGGTVTTIVLTEKGDDALLPAIIENKGGTIGNAYATINSVATENNNDANSVKLELWQSETNQGNVLVGDGATSTDIEEALNNKKEESLGVSISSLADFERFMVSSAKKCIFVADLLNTNTNSESVNNKKLNITRDVEIDGNGHKIIGNSNLNITNQNANVVIKNLTFEHIHNDKTKPDYAFDLYGFDASKYTKGTLSAIYASNFSGSLSVTNCIFDNVDWDCLQITPAGECEITITNNVFKHTADYQSTRYIHIESAGSYSIERDFKIVITNNDFYDIDQYPTNNGCIESYTNKSLEKTIIKNNYFEGTYVEDRYYQVCVAGSWITLDAAYKTETPNN